MTKKKPVKKKSVKNKLIKKKVAKNISYAFGKKYNFIRSLLNHILPHEFHNLEGNISIDEQLYILLFVANRLHFYDLSDFLNRLARVLYLKKHNLKEMSSMGKPPPIFIKIAQEITNEKNKKSKI